MNRGLLKRTAHFMDQSQCCNRPTITSVVFTSAKGQQLASLMTKRPSMQIQRFSSRKGQLTGLADLDRIFQLPLICQEIFSKHSGGSLMSLSCIRHRPKSRRKNRFNFHQISRCLKIRSRRQDPPLNNTSRALVSTPQANSRDSR